MARIRSVHPGLFTDEAFMEASPHARLLLIGLWTEADDQGVFEWKPLTLKARILPVDAVDIPVLLAELEALNFIRGYEHNGRRYGAVRNFRRYQRPKKPNAAHFIPAELRTYVALDEESSEPTDDETPPSPPKSEPTRVDPPPVRNQFSTGGEKSPQMEDGGRRKEGKEDSASLRSAEQPRAALDAIERRCREAGDLANEASPGLLDLSPILSLIDQGYDLDRDILPVIRAKARRGRKPGTWRYFVDAIVDARAQNAGIRAAPPPPTSLPTVDDGWRNKVRAYQRSGTWVADWDGKPGDPDCRVPPHILAEFGYAPAPESRV